jgi:hypothetical protein
VAINKIDHDKELQYYYKESERITKWSSKFPVTVAAASGLPLYTKFASTDSRVWLSTGLAAAGGSILIDYVRSHLNLKHYEVILTNSSRYSDFYFRNTCWGTSGEVLFWIRGLLNLIAGAALIYGLYIFKT